MTDDELAARLRRAFHGKKDDGEGSWEWVSPSLKSAWLAAAREARAALAEDDVNPTHPLTPPPTFAECRDRAMRRGDGLESSVWSWASGVDRFLADLAERTKGGGDD